MVGLRLQQEDQSLQAELHLKKLAMMQCREHQFKGEMRKPAMVKSVEHSVDRASTVSQKLPFVWAYIEGEPTERRRQGSTRTVSTGILRETDTEIRPLKNLHCNAAFLSTARDLQRHSRYCSDTQL